jgi:hypothetical protein
MFMGRRRRMSRQLAVAACALGVAVGGFSSAGASVAGNLQFTADCPIEDQTVLLDPDDGRTIDLDVLVLLDGVDQARGETIFADVGRPYDELGVRVVPTYQVADPPFTKITASGIMGEAKARFPDAKVPAEYDLVEVLTSKDITGASGSSTAGLANCLGGIRDDTRAYEVSEAGTAEDDAGTRLVPQLPATTLSVKKAAKITAHEMGHLLGAQHYYSNCAEGIDPDDELSDKSPCTLMFPDVNPASLHFDTLNGRIVRGYAVRYASGNDA